MGSMVYFLILGNAGFASSTVCHPTSSRPASMSQLLKNRRHGSCFPCGSRAWLCAPARCRGRLAAQSSIEGIGLGVLEFGPGVVQDIALKYLDLRFRFTTDRPKDRELRDFTTRLQSSRTDHTGQAKTA